MERERWEGTASYAREGPTTEGSLTIQRIQSYRSLVTIDAIGQGKVEFDRDGSFRGHWALENRIYDVQGQARGDRTFWEGTFEIRDMKGHRIIHGSFRANRTAT